MPVLVIVVSTNERPQPRGGFVTYPFLAPDHDSIEAIEATLRRGDSVVGFSLTYRRPTPDADAIVSKQFPHSFTAIERRSIKTPKGLFLDQNGDPLPGQGSQNEKPNPDTRPRDAAVT